MSLRRAPAKEPRSAGRATKAPERRLFPHYRWWGVSTCAVRLCSDVANDLTKRLLARVRQIREAQGLSQEAFAEKAGLKYKHYQAIEAGRKPNLQLPTLIKIAQALGLEPWQLLNFEMVPAVLAESSGNDFQTKPGMTPSRRVRRQRSS